MGTPALVPSSPSRRGMPSLVPPAAKTSSGMPVSASIRLTTGGPRHSLGLVHNGAMENIATAKAKLSELVQRALNGEDVVISRNGVPVVRLVAIRPMSAEDPCRVIPELSIQVGRDALDPLGEEDWGELGG